MIELLMLLFIPTEIDPAKLGMKYILKEKFIDYKSCEEYVEENLYYRDDKNTGIFYKIDTKEYQVMLTYCKPVKEKND
jgi:hypothetical protein|tara:strand:- start:288 stop:521 length:234 start_codon:yes stop_codon:yes gene_type:complete